MTAATLDHLLAIIRKSYTDSSLVKITISGPLATEVPYQKIKAKLVVVKKVLKLQFVYSYPNKDVTKNYDLEEACDIIKEELSGRFRNITIIGTDTISQYNPKSKKIDTTQAIIKRASSKTNDKRKQRIVAKGRPFLTLLGISNENGIIKSAKQKKYKQINKYVELLAADIRAAQLTSPYTIMDMGSGKGYLTFALYDYLTESLGHQVKVVGIELREALVANGNRLAQELGFERLSFQSGYISDIDASACRVLIALHACDTATDDAIAAGLAAKAQLIVCSPCCHKQIRKQMHAEETMQAVTQYGILKERQAELITDTIRALILEYHGYKTKVMEFISTEHTPKNLLITAVRIDKPKAKQQILAQIAALKKEFGIEYHYLEKATGLI